MHRPGLGIHRLNLGQFAIALAMSPCRQREIAVHGGARLDRFLDAFDPAQPAADRPGHGAAALRQPSRRLHR
jgi:hypothetical protein